MKIAAIFSTIIVIALLGFLIFEVRDLRQDLAAMEPSAAAKTTPSGPSKQFDDFLVHKLNTELQAQLSDQKSEIFARMQIDREAMAQTQHEAIAEYFASDAFEDRMWAMVTGFILDFTHPDNATIIEKQIREQQAAYQEEQMRKHPQKHVTNNLRIIASAGQQYILEEGVESVTYQQLEGDYFSPLQSASGERYDTITVTEDGGTIQAVTADGTVVEFTY